MRRVLSIIPLLLAFVATDSAAQTAGRAECYDPAWRISGVGRNPACEGSSTHPQPRSRALRWLSVRGGTPRNQNWRTKAPRIRPVYRLDSAGAAFSLNAKGDFLTSAHVINGCDRLEARFGNEVSPLPVNVKARDDTLDLAVLFFPARTRHFMRFAPIVPENGDALALIGFPKKGSIPSTPSLTPVQVSHALRDPRRGPLTGLRGDIRRGHSGGPALDRHGRAVGVLKAKIDTKEALRRTGRVFTDLGVFVDARRVVRFLERSEIQYWLDGKTPIERSVDELETLGVNSVIRIDCLKHQ